MNNRVFNFQDNNEEETCCEACETTDQYFEAVINADSPEEVWAIMREFYDDAFLQGVQDSLLEDIKAKADLFNQLSGAEVDID